MQQAHSQLVVRQNSIPDIKVTDVSSPARTRKHVESNKRCPKTEETNVKTPETNHMTLPLNHVDLKNHCHPLKATQSQCTHAPTMAEQGKNVYHSEPANLNGSVHAHFSPVGSASSCHIFLDVLSSFLFFFYSSGTGRIAAASRCRRPFAPSCECSLKSSWSKRGRFNQSCENIADLCIYICWYIYIYNSFKVFLWLPSLQTPLNATHCAVSYWCNDAFSLQTSAVSHLHSSALLQVSFFAVLIQHSAAPPGGGASLLMGSCGHTVIGTIFWYVLCVCVRVSTV